VVNLAADPAFAGKLAALRETLMSELTKQNDPRALGQGDVFDQYLSPRTKTADSAPEKKKNKKAKP
jgi:N-sulfoglucosamine sulfohydrolase